MFAPNLQNRCIRIGLGWLLTLVVLFIVLFGINLLPSKSSFEYRPELPPMFKKLAEYKYYSSYFEAYGNNLGRIDVLFKNQALESKEELKVQIYDDKNKLIFEQNYDSGNFGDTNRVRMDFKPIVDSKGKRFMVLITPLKIIDWKMYFGVKGGDIDLIQYFSIHPSIYSSYLIGIKLMQNFVFLLPLLFVTMFLW